MTRKSNSNGGSPSKNTPQPARSRPTRDSIGGDYTPKPQPDTIMQTKPAPPPNKKK